MVTTLRFSLHLDREAFMRYYRGAARTVLVRTEDGRSLQFPAESLRPFVAADGIHGRFEIDFGDNNKLIALRQLPD